MCITYLFKKLIGKILKIMKQDQPIITKELKKLINVMLTCVGGELMPYTIKYLKNIKSLKIKIIGTDNDTNAIGKYFCDKFYNLPKGSNKSYIS